MTTKTRQTEVQALAEPVIEETIARLANAGIASHEIAQALILTGAGLLAGSIGPKGAGASLELTADMMGQFLREIANRIEETH